MEYLAAADADLPLEHPAPGGTSNRLLSRGRRSPEIVAARTSGNSGVEDLSPVAGGPTRGSRRAGSRPAGGPLRVPTWLWAGVIVALIAGGLLLIVLGAASGSGTSDSTPTTANVDSVPSTLPSPPPKAPEAPVKLDRRQFADRVSIGIPAGWNAGVEGLAVTVAALNGRAEVQAYFEHGARPDDQLMREARAFLMQRHAGASVAAIGPTDLGGRAVRRVRVVYATGTESAVVLVAGGYSYLILERLEKPFSPDLRRTTDAVVASFRPI
jgi:hypothetical protein